MKQFTFRIEALFMHIIFGIIIENSAKVVPKGKL